MAFAATLSAALCSYLLPDSIAATSVGFAFLGFTYWCVLRDDDDGSAARAFGLALGGIFEPEPLDPWRMIRASLAAFRDALIAAAVVFPLFWLGFLWWWQPPSPFIFPEMPDVWDQVLGQVLVIALPEEAFYRGYLQTSLDRALPRRLSLLGAEVGLALVLTSALFALGHWLTETDASRLAVFFPALLFGWLRVRTGSIAAPVLLHAASNLFASILGRGYGLFE